MRKALIGLSLGIITFFAGCKSENQEPNCSSVSCYQKPISLKVRFVEKASGKDLLFDANPEYSVNDFKATESSVRESSIIIELDTVNKVVIIVHFRSEDQIQLGDLPPDRIAIRYRAIPDDQIQMSDLPSSRIDEITKTCCGSKVEIDKLSVGELLVCEPCKNLDDKIVVIEK